METAPEKTKIPKQNEMTSTNLTHVFIEHNPDLNQFSRYNWNVKAADTGVYVERGSQWPRIGGMKPPGFQCACPHSLLQPYSVSAKPVRAPQNTIPHSKIFFSPLGSLNKRTHTVPTVDLNCALLSCNPMHVCDDNLTSHFDFLLSAKSNSKRQMQPCGSIQKSKAAHRNQISRGRETSRTLLRQNTVSGQFSQVLPSVHCSILSLTSAPSAHGAAKQKA